MDSFFILVKFFCHKNMSFELDIRERNYLDLCPNNIAESLTHFQDGVALPATHILFFTASPKCR